MKIAHKSQLIRHGYLEQQAHQFAMHAFDLKNSKDSTKITKKTPKSLKALIFKYFKTTL